ncbi:MAG: hypothetical protein EBR86_01245 [Planctomycetia bacterium]|nr:hypothetical protein [Planctomycetia bacterium]
MPRHPPPDRAVFFLRPELRGGRGLRIACLLAVGGLPLLPAPAAGSEPSLLRPPRFRSEAARFAHNVVADASQPRWSDGSAERQAGWIEEPAEFVLVADATVEEIAPPPPSPEPAHEEALARGPPLLRAPVDNPFDLAAEEEAEDPLWRYPSRPPAGFTGRSSVIPEEAQESSHFVPIEDRWRLGLPAWDRYGQGHPRLFDYPYAPGNWLNPYTQHLLKEDFPIMGQHTFFDMRVASRSIVNWRQVPTPNTPFESTPTPGQYDFYGNPNGFLYLQYYSLAFELNHGDKAFKPNDWRLRVVPVFNHNYLQVNELGVVSPDVQLGDTRYRGFSTIEEWFVESKIADTPDYDFTSVRVGSQPFTTDFRGFIFSDVNRAIRLFGTRLANRDQFNVAIFDQREKDTNSFLNTFDSRGQEILVLNYYRQDFLFPGHTAQTSFIWDHDQKSLQYDKNGFLVRPDPVGIATPHEVNALYAGITTDGHINDHQRPVLRLRA